MLYSCSQETTSSDISDDYVDLHQYFLNEVKELKKKDPVVEKVVSKEDDQEIQKLRIENWDIEMGSFTSIDLLKPAYQGTFSVDSSKNGVIEYLSTDRKTDINAIHIKKDSLGTIEQITIDRHIDNMLYQTKEKLIYKKDTFYSLEKSQKILFLGTNNYQIQGTFLN